MLEVKHIVGLDLGQVSDPSALVSLRREKFVPDPIKPTVVSADRVQVHREKKGSVQLPKYFCNIAARFERGTPYPRLVDNVAKLYDDPKFAGQPLVVDGTGVGRPVVDLFRKAKLNCRLIPVTITGGAVSQALGSTKVDEWGYWHVPKKELVGSVQVLLGTGRLEVAPGIPDALTLVHELKNFNYKISNSTGHVTLEAWRERDHDDLVLALAMAAWVGERCNQELWVR